MNVIDNPSQPCLNDSSSVMICSECHTVPIVSFSSDYHISTKCKCQPKVSILLSDFIRSYLTKNQKKVCYNTKKHGSKNAEQFCIECNKWICDSCLVIHNDFMSEHHLTGLPNKHNTCQIHHQEELTMYCKQCKDTFCELCKDRHYNHTIGSAKNMYSDSFYEKIKNQSKEIHDIIYEKNVEIKINAINFLKQKIKEVEESFQYNFKINEELLMIYNSLIENYRINKDYPNYASFYNIMSIPLNLDRLKLEAEKLDCSSTERVINYFKFNYIIISNNKIGEPSYSLVIDRSTELLDGFVKKVFVFEDKNILTFIEYKNQNLYSLILFDKNLSKITEQRINFIVQGVSEIKQNTIIIFGDRQADLWIKRDKVLFKEYQFNLSSLNINHIYSINSFGNNNCKIGFCVDYTNSNKNYNMYEGGYCRMNNNSSSPLLVFGSSHPYTRESSIVYTDRQGCYIKAFYSIINNDDNSFICCSYNKIFYYEYKNNKTVSFKKEVIVNYNNPDEIDIKPNLVKLNN